MHTPDDPHAPDPSATPDPDRLPARPAMEPLTTEEKEAFLARARAQGRSLTSEEQYAIFGPAPEPAPARPQHFATEMEAAALDDDDLTALQHDFFPELGDSARPSVPTLVTGVIFDFDYTLAALSRPLDELMEEGAKAAEAFMRSRGMTLPPDFWTSIVEARRFSEEKSEEEMEEHLADDALSFLLQFYGYPASKLDPAVLRQTVDIFYAPEMTAWRLYPGAREMLAELQTDGYRLALVANHGCDRVFQRTIDYLGLRPFFDITLATSSVEYRKPDTAVFRVILDRWDALPYEVVVVGDSLRHDIAAGIELGALTVRVLFGGSTQIDYNNKQLANEITPDATLEDLALAPALIREWTEP